MTHSINSGWSISSNGAYIYVYLWYGITQILGCPLSKPHKFEGPIPGLKVEKNQ
jgi:hypothetical protein